MINTFDKLYLVKIKYSQILYMSFSKHNMYAILFVSIVFICLALLGKFTINDTYLGRLFIVAIILSLTYFNTWLGILSVAAIIYMKINEGFVNVNQLFNEQNHLQKDVYYVPKKREVPVPQNDTDFVPLNPMQSKAGAIQPSQPAKISLAHSEYKQKTKVNNSPNLLRIEEAIRAKSSKSMNVQTGLNKDYEPESNWPDGNAFKNPYSAAEQ